MKRLHSLLALLFFSVAAIGAPESADFEHARTLFDAHRFPEARSLFEKLSQAEPENAEVHYYLGELALEHEDTPAALRELEKAVSLEPASARIHHALGYAYGNSAEKAGVLSKFSLARKCVAEFERAVAIEPDNVDFHESLLKYYSRAPSLVGGGAAKAEGEAKTIARLDPTRGHQAYATLYFDQGRYDLSLAELDKVLKSAPMDYGTLYQIGRQAAVSGRDLERGLDALRLCLKITPPAGAPSHPTVEWRIGAILERKSDPAGARAAYTAALKMDPGYAPALESLENLK